MNIDTIKDRATEYFKSDNEDATIIAVKYRKAGSQVQITFRYDGDEAESYMVYGHCAIDEDGEFQYAQSAIFDEKAF